MFCQKILLAYDGTEGAVRALQKTKELAKVNPHLVVHLLYVQQPPSALIGVGEAYVVSQDALETRFDPEVETSLRLAEGELSPYAVCSIEMISHETPGREILEQAKRFNCDLIVIGSRGLGGFKKLILGSISSYVVNHSTVPVLVVK